MPLMIRESGTILCALALSYVIAFGEPPARDDGYRGIWYQNQPSGDVYRYKYSGGFATYPQQQLPIAYYSKEAGKTFFCYGGRSKEKNELLHMASYFDHKTGMVPKPVILLNKGTDDAHDNPTLMLDAEGYIWIFSNSHGTSRPSYIHRSTRPYSIDDFERVATTNFSYGQPWYIADSGFLFLHTRYGTGVGQAIRVLNWMTSVDGKQWSEPKPLAMVDFGHYQVSGRNGRRVGTVFNYHPKSVGLNARTNLYYLESADFGKTWRNVQGVALQTPLTEAQNGALVHDYKSESLLVYLKDLQFDAKGSPVILYLTSKGYQSGPSSDPRTWRTACWTGKAWEIHPVTASDHNYDFGSLYIEKDGTWRIIAPTDPGPQAWGTGGSVVMWTSTDQGKTWKKLRELTPGATWNHTYVRRPVNAHPDFYGLWADGDVLAPSESRLYFTNKAGDRVWGLPVSMTSDFARPEPLR